MTIHSSPPRLPILSSPATEGSLVQRLIGSRSGRALKPRGHQILVRGPCGSGAGLPDPTGGRATAFWRPDKAAPPAGSRLRVRRGGATFWFQASFIRSRQSLSMAILRRITEPVAFRFNASRWAGSIRTRASSLRASKASGDRLSR